MGIFDKEKSIRSDRLRENLKRDSGVIPHTGGKKFDMGQREKISRDIFGDRYGGEIDKNDFRDAVRRLEKEEQNAKDNQARRELKQKIDYLKRIGGEN